MNIIDQIDYLIEAMEDEIVVISSSINYIRHPTMGGVIYFRKDRDGDLLEFSHVSATNQQLYVATAQDYVYGDSKYIREFMIYHLKHHGELYSSQYATFGSMKLWLDFFNENRHLKFEAFAHDVKIHDIEELSESFWLDKLNVASYIRVST